MNYPQKTIISYNTSSHYDMISFISFLIKSIGRTSASFPDSWLYSVDDDTRLDELADLTRISNRCFRSIIWRIPSIRLQNSFAHSSYTIIKWNKIEQSGFLSWSDLDTWSSPHKSKKDICRQAEYWTAIAEHLNQINQGLGGALCQCHRRSKRRVIRYT